MSKEFFKPPKLSLRQYLEQALNIYSTKNAHTDSQGNTTAISRIHSQKRPVQANKQFNTSKNLGDEQGVVSESCQSAFNVCDSQFTQQSLAEILISHIPSPCYVLHYDSLESNLQLLHNVAKASDCKILIALKGYSFWREFDGVRKYLNGATCSGAWEARLAYEEIVKPSQDYPQYSKAIPLCEEVNSSITNTKSLNIEMADDAPSNNKTQANIECSQIESSQQKSLLQANYLLDSMDDVPINSKDICVFSPAYQESQMQEILQYATHIIFNSFAQWHRFKAMIDSKNKELMVSQQEQIRKIQVGLRINPLYSEVEPPIYNPCIPKSRLGIIPSEFYKGIDTYSALYGYKSHEEFFTAEFCGLHFHTHCEQDSAALSRTLPHVVKHFDSYIALSKWINFGGGHHITREDYNCDLLISLIQDFKAKYKGIEVFLEPGEAVGWQCGDLIGTVIDIIQNEGNVAILDISASCHAPDCLEMPYRPECYKISLQDSTLQNGAKSSRDSCLVDTQNIENSHVSKHETNNSMRSHVLLDSSDKNCIQRLSIESDLGENKGKYRYRFGGPTCLAGDIIGDYSFNTELRIGDRIAFCDMIHYTIVKNTTFNGVELPKLGVIKNDTFTLLKEFDYLDFKNRN